MNINLGQEEIFALADNRLDFATEDLMRTNYGLGYHGSMSAPSKEKLEALREAITLLQMLEAGWAKEVERETQNNT